MSNIIFILSIPLLLFFVYCGSDKDTLQPTLTDNTWKLTKIETGKNVEKLIGKPNNYTIRFYDDGKLKVKSDCNKCSGKYTVTSKFIKLSNLDCSNKICGKESFDYLYKKFLNESSSFSLDPNGLVLESFKGKLVLSKK